MASPQDRDFLYWFGKNLAAAGLLKNNPWVQRNVHVAYKLTEHMGTGWVSCAMVCVHPYALDYLKQSPMLSCGATLRHLPQVDPFNAPRVSTQQFGFEKSAYLEVAKDMAMLCNHKKNLKEVHHFFQVPYGLRQFPHSIVDINTALTIPRLSCINPSVLAQSLKRNEFNHRVWLLRISSFMTGLARNRAQNLEYTSTLIEWFVQNLISNCVPPLMNGSYSDLADYLVNPRCTFNRRWSIERAWEKMIEWHEQLGEERNLGPNPDEIIPYDKLPLVTEIDGYEIIALNTLRKMHQEGAHLHHCLGSYGPRLAHRSFFFSIRRLGLPMSTMEIVARSQWPKQQPSLPSIVRSQYQIIQHKGSYNTCPERTTGHIAHKFVELINKRDDIEKPS